MDGPALEKLIESNQKKSQEKPVNSPAAPPVPKKDDPDEARKRGLETIRKKPYEVFLESWPDETLPQDFIDPKLNGLRIRGGGLRRLPSDLFTRFPNLTFLMIENVSLEKIPENFEKIQSLKRLTLIKTGLTGLPDIQLVGIDFLDLTDNHIPSIPAGWLPSSLETCNFSNNRLKKFSLKGINLPVLEGMDLSANSISELELGDLPKIDRLNLSENQLKILPPSIGLCMNLEYLSLDINHLISLPDSMSSMQKLRVLNLSYNRFEKLPDVLDRISPLSILGFRGNSIPINVLLEKKKC